ncbi:MAG: DUF427 domain-containing protein [Gammaproteobacteria bacterium]|nr:DUF427 domain-containing protein [Gammaproteobacteria bacterium]
MQQAEQPLAEQQLAEHRLEQDLGPARPDSGFSLQPYPKRLQAWFDGVRVVDTHRARLMREGRLPPVLYMPREDVRMDLMSRSEYRTWCPFKGAASYWSLRVGDREARDVMWSYEDPLPEAESIRDEVAFHPQMLEWIGQPEPSQSGSRSAHSQSGEGYANPLLGWLLEQAPASADARVLTRGLAETLLDAGVALWRLHVIIRTLHPQLMAVAYRWWTKLHEVEQVQVPYEMLSRPEYLNSPLVPIYQGAGGIRRRLDVADPVLDYPVLQELHAEGATDYVAMPMVFSDGQVNIVTLASNRRGGFKTTELAHLYEVLAVLGRLYEVHAMRYRANTLLDTYLGRHAGGRVLNGLIKRGDADNIRAVIWFCDLRDSTPLAYSMPRRSFLAVLDQFFDCMAGAVMDHGGQVLRFIGDAALAIFPIQSADGPDRVASIDVAGRPASLADAAEGMNATQAREAALDAATAAVERMAQLNERRASEGEPRLGYGIGLHEGEVSYGNIGTRERLEFTVIGDAANRAARIETLCKVLDRPVLVSTPLTLCHPERFESLGEHRLRGVKTPVALFALRSARPPLSDSPERQP